MAGVLCDAGVQVLNVELGNAIVGLPVEVALFVNNHTPAVGDTLGTYTEAAFGGYARQPLVSYVDNGVTGHIDSLQFAPVVFTCTGAPLTETAYGFFLTVLGVLVGAVKFGTPIPVNAAGQAVVVVATLSYQDRSIA
jgi:hypothetical protein